MPEERQKIVIKKKGAGEASVTRTDVLPMTRPVDPRETMICDLQRKIAKQAHTIAKLAQGGVSEEEAEFYMKYIGKVIGCVMAGNLLIEGKMKFYGKYTIILDLDVDGEAVINKQNLVAILPIRIAEDLMKGVHG